MHTAQAGQLHLATTSTAAAELRDSESNWREYLTQTCVSSLLIPSVRKKSLLCSLGMQNTVWADVRV